MHTYFSFTKMFSSIHKTSDLGYLVRLLYFFQIDDSRARFFSSFNANNNANLI